MDDIIFLISSTFQRNFSLSVNSVAVLRLMGKGGGAVPPGVSRGRGTVRGGRGKLSPEYTELVNFGLGVPRPCTKLNCYCLC